jgi:hypothetical protein
MDRLITILTPLSFHGTVPLKLTIVQKVLLEKVVVLLLYFVILLKTATYGSCLTRYFFAQGLLVEPNPFVFKRGLAKHRKAYKINTCLSILPRTTFLPFE